MKLEFITNDYLLIWNLLYGSSISIRIHVFKQKLWLLYKNAYKKQENDKNEILKDSKNFIPDDNTIYDYVEDANIFYPILKETENHRRSLMREWDLIKRKVEKELVDVLRFKIGNCKVIVLHPGMDANLICYNTKSIGWGKSTDLDDFLKTALEIISSLLKMQVKYEEDDDENIKNALLEMVVENEVYTRLKTSNYFRKNDYLLPLKKELYPYLLMYLGIDLDDTTSYMMRDNMAFDISRYTNEIQLRKLDIFEFIDFVVRNKKIILKNKRELVEVL